MENIGYIGLSGQVALRAQMDTLSNNIANANTTGYQSQHMVFEEYITPAGKDAPITMVNDYGQYRNTLPGPISNTGNNLDFALQGNGYFSVQTKDGEELYTRNGAFQLNTQRQIVNSSGLPILNNGGQAITIPADTNNVTVASNGQISANGNVIGEFKLSSVENPNSMQNVGGGLLKATGGVQPAQDTQVFQGMIENSNVNPVLEMTEMIEVLRKYQSVARLLQTDHDRQRNTISTLARVRQ